MTLGVTSLYLPRKPRRGAGYDVRVKNKRARDTSNKPEKPADKRPRATCLECARPHGAHHGRLAAMFSQCHALQVGSHIRSSERNPAWRMCNVLPKAVAEMDMMARCGDTQVCVYTTLTVEMRNRALQPKARAW